MQLINPAYLGEGSWSFDPASRQLELQKAGWKLVEELLGLPQWAAGICLILRERCW